MGFDSGPRLQALVLAGIFAVALALRYLAILSLGGQDYLPWAMQNYFGGITPGYLRLADEILDGHYSVMSYPPGYPALLALLKFVGLVDLTFVRVAQSFIDSLGVFLAFWLLRRAGAGVAIALAGAFGYAAFPPLVTGSGFILAEFATPLLMMACLALVLWSGRISAKPGDRVAAGVFIGLAALVRPDMLLLPLLLGAWLLLTTRSLRQTAVFLTLLVAGFAVPILAWGVHNKVVHGHWVFSTTGGGSALYQGLGVVQNPHGYVISDALTAEMLRDRNLQWLSVEADRFLKQEYLRAWRDHPDHVVKAIKARATLILTESESWFPEIASAQELKKGLDAFGAIMAIACLVVFRRRPAALLITVVPVLYALGSLGMTHWEPRYARYVSVAYLFCGLLLLQALATAIPARVSGRAARVSSFGVPLLVLLMAVLMASEVMHSLVLRAFAAQRQAELSSAVTRGEIAPSLDLCQEKFTIASAVPASVTSPCAPFETTAVAHAYELVFTQHVPPGTAVRVSAAGALEAGSFAFGLLKGDGSRWLGVSTQSTAGAFSDSVTGDSGDMNSVIVVVANANPHGRSRIDLARLEIQCFPAACVSAVPEQSRIASTTASDSFPPVSWKPGVDVAIPVFRDSAVREFGPDGIVVDGPAATPFSYLLRLPEFKTSSGVRDPHRVRAYLIVEGHLEHGGLTVGLLRGDQWVQPSNVTAPGSFRLALAVREPGVYSPLIANNLARSGESNRFTVTTLRWVQAE